jgi:hypothetical protein
VSANDCLSMLELAAYRAGEDVPGAEQHLTACARCRALLAGLPELQPSALPQSAPELPYLQPRPDQARPQDLKTGQLWTAAPEHETGWRELVVVLAPQPAVDGHEMVLIAPVDTSFDDATSTDLIVDESPLGYRHLVSVGMQGIVLRAQLDRYRGRLELPEREAIVDIYRALLGESQRATQAPTGPPLTGPDDPRASARATRADELRSLFAPADRLLGQEPEDDAPEMITLGGILSGVIAGDEWDRPALLTAAAVDGAVFDRMLDDRLDLTDQRDVTDVQRVLTVIRLDDWRGPVRASLQRSRGGVRRATGAEPAIAARSFAGLSDAERERDLMRDQTAIDESAPARKRAVESYLQALEKQIDDAE